MGFSNGVEKMMIMLDSDNTKNFVDSVTVPVGDLTTQRENMTKSILDRVLEHHRAQSQQLSTTQRDKTREAALARPSREKFRGFRAALRLDEAGEPAVISEIKRRSPSKGMLYPDLDPASVARDYQAGGASCLSVLTDAEFFGGSIADLEAARQSCDLPVLRKDFVVDSYDIDLAAAVGADCVLLIVAALSQEQLVEFLEHASLLGIDALVEVFDADELRRAADAGATMIGVNQRDLRTFEVDVRRAAALAELMPAGVTQVAESGIATRADVVALKQCGYAGLLIGESLVTAQSQREMLSYLLGKHQD